MADPTAWVRWYIASFAPQIGPDDDYRIFGGLWLSHLRMVLDRLDAREREYTAQRDALVDGELERGELASRIEQQDYQIRALTARAEQAERERDEWKAAAYKLGNEARAMMDAKVTNPSSRGSADHA